MVKKFDRYLDALALSSVIGLAQTSLHRLELSCVKYALHTERNNRTANQKALLAAPTATITRTISPFVKR